MSITFGNGCDGLGRPYRSRFSSVLTRCSSQTADPPAFARTIPCVFCSEQKAHHVGPFAPSKRLATLRLLLRATRRLIMSCNIDLTLPTYRRNTRRTNLRYARKREKGERNSALCHSP